MAEPPKKKRKLPSLDSLFDAPVRPTDSPDLHQGRKRTVPHERGQWASHVYLELEPSPAFRKLLKDAVALSTASPFGSSAECTSPSTIHSLLDGPSRPSLTSSSRPNAPADATALLSEPSAAGEALHLSLSRPLVVRTNQKGELRAGVARVAKEAAGFSARYASFGVLENDERTRRFLGIEVGAGYDEMHSLLRKVDEMLVSLRLPTYYETPRFHTSLAWSSLSSSSGLPAGALPFSDTLLQQLEQQYGKRLRAEDLYVSELCVKIGKDVARFALSGRKGQ
ncbi:hypothetical protein JCM10213_003564 [Rhodosporidiobolus nylandii]